MPQAAAAPACGAARRRVQRGSGVRAPRDGDPRRVHRGRVRDRAPHPAGAPAVESCCGVGCLSRLGGMLNDTPLRRNEFWGSKRPKHL